jgi:hypothetical protein
MNADPNCTGTRNAKQIFAPMVVADFGPVRTCAALGLIA